MFFIHHSIVEKEAPSLEKSALVMRPVTEHTGSIEAGKCLLVGYNKMLIIKETFKLLDSVEAYTKMSMKINPYVDGKSDERILQIITKWSERGVRK